MLITVQCAVSAIASNLARWEGVGNAYLDHVERLTRLTYMGYVATSLTVAVIITVWACAVKNLHTLDIFTLQVSLRN